ncbi:hypothetical protein ABVT39_026163, partial [Epinephelus coioides]
YLQRFKNTPLTKRPDPEKLSTPFDNEKLDLVEDEKASYDRALVLMQDLTHIQHNLNLW